MQPEKTYEGYFENGNFYFEGKVLRLPERKSIKITIPTIAGESDKAQDKEAMLVRVRNLCGIVSSDIDEKTELAQAREEKHGRID